ncbi:cell division protein SepF [Gordonibacter sp. An230]|uniref:cell division protein SepF n=1 Tax=Gordonibacter sp. An230 TaxID=1965592 RepID=UPI000B3983B0|nr:cell division protein SepF [Gordonibacter sp. An230]OUO90078.1 cell division protein SepF [Gordonibacter sp. An230]
MELPKIKKSEHGVLDGIKSKLGFANAGQGYDDYDDDYDGDYGEYGDDYAAVDDRDDDAPGSRYDPYAPITTRPARASRARASSRGAGVVPPKLVSIDDVRARTQVPESLTRDPLPPRRVTSSPLRERTMVDADTPVPANTPNARAASASARERSESLNALFSSTAEEASSAASAPAASSASATSFDPYEALTGTGSAKHDPSRSLTVLKPASYGEVERIAKALKAGDAVVLALRNTPDALAKRILDFSFGVSSALDASVDCVADKVFVIARGSGLTESERASLRNQGVL